MWELIFIGVEHAEIMKSTGNILSWQKNEIYLVTNTYQSCTTGSRNLELQFLRNKTRKYICLYVVRRYKQVVFVALWNDYHAFLHFWWGLPFYALLIIITCPRLDPRYHPYLFLLNSNHAERIITYFVANLRLPQTQNQVDRDAFFCIT